MTRERAPKGGWLPPGPDFANGETWEKYLAKHPSPGRGQRSEVRGHRKPRRREVFRDMYQQELAL